MVKPVRDARATHGVITVHGSDTITVHGSDTITVHGSDTITVHGSDMACNAGTRSL